MAIIFQGNHNRIMQVCKVCFCLLILLSFSKSKAQRMEKHKLTVAYVNSFLKNIEWPESKASYRIYVVSDEVELIEEFEKLARTRRVKEKPIEVFFSTSLSIPVNIDVVYLPAEYSGAVASVNEQIEGKDVLLITDQASDERLIMINFYSDQNESLGFEINRANIINQGLRILPEMLILAGSEVDVARLYREARDSVRSMESEIGKLQGRYDSLAFNVSRIQRIIQNQNIKIDEQLDEIYEKQSIINIQSASLDTLTKEYEESERKLDSIVQSLESREGELITLQGAIEQQSAQLNEGNETLEQQLVLINKQDQEIRARESRLQEMTTIVDSQQNTLVYLILFLIAVIVMATLIYRAYTARKRDAKKLLEQKEELSELVNELHQTQSQLVQSEKMASLGVLTAGIAHEINNAINFVYSGIQILEMKFSDIKPVLTEFKEISIEESGFKKRIKNLIAEKERIGYNESQELIDQMIQNIQIGVERTTEIVKGLRTFSRSEEEEKTKVNIHKDLEVALLLLKSRYKDAITVEKRFDKKIPEIYGYQGQLGQAFLNIINNAIDAVQNKGKDAKITIETDIKKDIITVAISDNGVGIPEEISDRIFDPFFTTKKVGAGTGLGLSITYGIIEKHGGSIAMDQKKYGTEFIISLPIAVA